MTSPYLIFGGTGGMGVAVARRLAARGKALHLVGRRPEALAEVAAELNAKASVADVTCPEQIVRATGEAGPQLQGLVFAVGSITLKPVGRLSDVEVLSDFQLNALAALQAIRAALPALKAADGVASIVLFSTVAVQQGFTAHASVAMAKGAVEGLTRALAAELAPKIRVNCVAPSLTDTPLAAALTSNAQMAASLAALHPLQRLGTADDSAAMAAFLLSEEAGWITGQIFGVDGGRSSLRTKG